MTRTFLITLEVDPGADLLMEADMIRDSLEQDGFPVADVKPWAGATTVPIATPLAPAFVAPTTQPILPGVSSTPSTYTTNTKQQYKTHGP